jgi:hypothetical protein
MNEKSQITKERLYSVDKKHIGNQERGDRKGEKHDKTKATEKSSSKQFQVPSMAH